jgi:hypothetical protein
MTLLRADCGLRHWWAAARPVDGEASHIVMVVWQLPTIEYWFCARELRRGYVNPTDRERCISILAELARQPDAIRQRAQQVLLELHRKGYLSHTSFA